MSSRERTIKLLLKATSRGEPLGDFTLEFKYPVDNALKSRSMTACKVTPHETDIGNHQVRVDYEPGVVAELESTGQSLLSCAEVH